MAKPKPSQPGLTIHVLADAVLLKRINTCMEFTECENRAQMGRLAFRRLCDTIERRQADLAKAKKQEERLTS